MTADTARCEALDLQMYRHALAKTGQSGSDEAFHDGYAKGEFHFSSDPALLGELITVHGLNLHAIGADWLVFRDGKSVFGVTPADAVCRWVIAFA